MPNSEATLERQYAARVVGSIPRATIVHHVGERGELYVSEGRKIVCWEQGQRTVLGRFPWLPPRDLFGFSRLSQRAARADKCNVFVTSAGEILGIRGEWVYALRGGTLHPLWQIQGDSVLHGGLCEQGGQIYFGEYFRNPQRGPVRLWRIDSALRQWDVACEFPAGRYRHLHAVTTDPYDPTALWAAVGDADGECYLLRSTNGFQTYDQVGQGTQLWRAVTLYFTPQHISWLTDSNLEQNYACRLDRRTQQLEQGAPLSAPAWYGCTTSEGLHVAFTTVEDGPGVQTDRAGMYVSEDAFHWQLVLDFAKDRYRPYKLFKYGVINCPSGMNKTAELYLSGEGLCGLDGTTLKVAIQAQGKT